MNFIRTLKRQWPFNLIFKKTDVVKTKMPKISLIVAMANNRVIGKGNQMPWHLPADLKHFKSVTMGKPVIMGRKTHESIGMVLPGRTNIIISRNEQFRSSFHNDKCQVVTSLEAAIEAAGEVEEVMIIGGANIYQQMIDKADVLHLTFIDLETDGDAHFPDWTHLEWNQVSKEIYEADDRNPYKLTFVTLEKC